MRRIVSFTAAISLLLVSSGVLLAIVFAEKQIPLKWAWAAALFLFVSVIWLWEDFLGSDL